MTDWNSLRPRNVGTTRYRNEDNTSIAALVDPMCPVFIGTNTSIPWNGVSGNGGAHTTTVGCEAKTVTTPSSAFGWKVRATGQNSVAMGTSIAGQIVNAVGLHSVAIGTPGAGVGGLDLLASGTNDVCCGSNCGIVSTGGLNSVFGGRCGVLGTSAGSGYFGNNGSITGTNSWVFGQAVLTGDDNIIIGNVTAGTGARNVIIAANLLNAPTHTGNDQTHVGSGHVSSVANNTTSYGATSEATAADATALGFGARATIVQATSVGSLSAATGAGALALGANASATVGNAVAIGFGITNAQVGSVLIGTNSVPVLRLLEPATGTLVKHTHEAVLATATPTPTVAQLCTGYLKLTEAGPFTLTLTSITGLLLDAYAPLLPLVVGMTFEVYCVTSVFAGIMTVGAPGAGVTSFGPLGPFGNHVGVILVFRRTGAAAWDMFIK